MELEQFIWGLPKEKYTDEVRTAYVIPEDIEGAGSVAFFPNEYNVADWFQELYEKRHPNELYNMEFNVEITRKDVAALKEQIENNLVKVCDKENMVAILEETDRLLAMNKYRIFYTSNF